uniref:Casein kinase n=1 Tax=Rhizophora mucronata TaxID=61149 RepID=A0A2P2MV74_RHIMU
MCHYFPRQMLIFFCAKPSSISINLSPNEHTVSSAWCRCKWEILLHIK